MSFIHFILLQIKIFGVRDPGLQVREEEKKGKKREKREKGGKGKKEGKERRREGRRLDFFFVERALGAWAVRAFT
jgi:hypothetical protein